MPCDRLGMLVIDEAFDCWRDGKILTIITFLSMPGGSVTSKACAP